MPDVARETEEPAQVRARIRRRELTTWLFGFGWPVLRVYALGTALTLALVLSLREMIAPRGEAAADADVLRFAVGYGVLVWTGPALWAGLSELAWKLARFWALVPALGIPLSVAGSLFFFQGVLRTRADEVVHAVSDCLDARSLSMLADPFVGGTSTPGPLSLPTMLAEAGAAFFDPPARAALASLRDELSLALTVALVPSVSLSLVALWLGYRAGYAVRHEADLARLARKNA